MNVDIGNSYIDKEGLLVEVIDLSPGLNPTGEPATMVDIRILHYERDTSIVGNTSTIAESIFEDMFKPANNYKTQKAKLSL